ncbi:MAG: DMT family transporter [Bacteroidota bacterium]
MRIPKGSQFMLLSAFFVSLISLGVKLLTRIPAAEVVFFKSLAALMITLSLLRYRQLPVWGTNHRLLLARGTSNALQVTLFFIMVQHIPLPSAFTIRYIAPIFTALLGTFIVNESLRLRQAVFFALSFAGIVLINGFALTEASWYIGVGLVSAFLGALSYNFVRKIEHQEHPLVIAFYAYFMSTLLMAPSVAHNFVALQQQEVFILGILSVLGFTAQYYSVKAYQHGPVAIVSATSYVAVFYALVFSYLFFNETLPLLKLLGLGLVLLGVLLNVFYGQKKTR